MAFEIYYVDSNNIDVFRDLREIIGAIAYLCDV